VDKKEEKIGHMSSSSPLKVIVLGECGVGKSSIIRRISTNKFDEDFDFDSMKECTNVQVKAKNSKKNVCFKVWDTAGQEQFQSLPRSYFRDAVACIVVYDVTNEASFSGAKAWKEELNRRRLDGGVIAILAGNKVDLDQTVAQEKIDMFANKSESVSIMCSAKTGKNIEHIFQTIALRIKKDRKRRSTTSRVKGPVSVVRRGSSSKKCVIS